MKRERKTKGSKSSTFAKSCSSLNAFKDNFYSYFLLTCVWRRGEGECKATVRAFGIVKV